MCDGCGAKVCVVCSTLLEDIIEDDKGHRYEHLCLRCISNISVDGTTYVGCKLILLNGGKDDYQEEEPEEVKYTGDTDGAEGADDT